MADEATRISLRELPLPARVSFLTARLAATVPPTSRRRALEKHTAGLCSSVVSVLGIR